MKYQIVTVAFPFTDNPSKKKVRPVVCLTEPVGKYQMMIIAYITSQRRLSETWDIQLNASHSEFSITQLSQSSTIKLHILTSISADDIIAVLGQVPEDISDSIRYTLAELFHLQRN